LSSRKDGLGQEHRQGSVRHDNSAAKAQGGQLLRLHALVCRCPRDPENCSFLLHGTHFQLAETICSPRPIRDPHPPILIGGGGEKKTLRLVAKYADACNLFATSPNDIAHKLDVLARHCEAECRDPAQIRTTILGGLDPLADTDNFLAAMEEYARLGVDLVEVMPMTPDPVAYAEQLSDMPQVPPGTPRSGCSSSSKRVFRFANTPSPRGTSAMAAAYCHATMAVRTSQVRKRSMKAWIAAAAVLLAGCGQHGRSAATSSTLLATVPAITSTAISALPTTAFTVPTTTATTTPAITAPATTAAPASTAPTVAATAFVDPSQPSDIDAAAYVVYDVGGQQWLAERDADVARPVASLMKLLTAYVVMQAGDPTHIATVPALHLDPAESAIGLYEGQRLSREVLLRAELIVSANDAARTLALDVGGTEDAFVGTMNSAAQDLGMGNTVAVNAVGLDQQGAHSSARDMVTIAAVLMQDPTFRATVARTDARMNGQYFNATNKLLTSYAGATGVKTGHTSDAGYCLVGSATRGDRSIIVAVLGAPTDTARIKGAAALLDWAFAQPAI
jgi:D-alanyl-D-alanine carboxypeptidase